MARVDRGIKFCEFDGLIIFPNRKEKQVVFLEVKNRKEHAGVGKTELIKKLKKLEITYEDDMVIQQKKGAKFYYSICRNGMQE